MFLVRYFVKNKINKNNASFAQYINALEILYAILVYNTTFKILCFSALYRKNEKSPKLYFIINKIRQPTSNQTYLLSDMTC